MPDIQQIAKEIVAREGGYVNDPDDPGGATKFGVTLGTLRRLGIDLDANGITDHRDVQALSREQATDIFLIHYFKRPNIASLPAALHGSVFDMYVNAGTNAVKILQNLLLKTGYGITADGMIGPQTQKAAADAYERGPAHLADAYAIERRRYYFDLADRRPASRKYARTRKGGKGGWMTRAETFMAPHYHLTVSQFQERTKSWD